MSNKGRGKKPNNVTYVHFTPRFNIGVFFMILIFIYLSVSIFAYLTKEKVLIYEVNAGTLVSNNTYTGVLIFDEEIVRSDKAGYVNYYINEADRAGANTIICSVDEVGNIATKLNTSISSSDSLSNNTINNISKQLIDYSKNYNDREYYQSYNVLDNISTTISEYKSSFLISELNELMKEDNHFVSTYKPYNSVMISFYTDSLYGLTPEMVSESTFDKENYNRISLKNRELIGVGDGIYRRFNSETFRIVFPLTANQVANYSNEEYVEVNFMEENIKVTAAFSIINKGEDYYGVIRLSKYLINFTDKRFVNFELSHTQVNGLKIPISSVCEKEFYTIPVEYGMTSEDSNKSTGFLVLTYDEAGNKVRKFTEATYYAKDNGYYYVSKDIFNVGDCIVKPPKEGEITFTDELYIVGTLDSLKGTYCINKGYCQFRKVVILEKNDEYYIVERGTLYGLSIYDHIILNADTVTENQIIY